MAKLASRRVRTVPVYRMVFEGVVDYGGMEVLSFSESACKCCAGYWCRVSTVQLTKSDLQ